MSQSALKIKRLITLAMLLCFVAPFVLGQQGQRRVASDEMPTLRREVELTTDGVKRATLHEDAEGAMQLYREALQIDSTYAPAHYALMKVLSRRVGGLERAEHHAKRAYELDTTNHWYLDGYAELALARGGYGGDSVGVVSAKELYGKLLRLDPRNLNAYRVLAVIEQQRGNMEGAVAILDTAEIRVGYNPYLARLKQMLLLQSGRQEVALEAAEALVAEAPFDISERLNLANLYVVVGRDSMAVESFERAFTIDTTNLETLLAYGSYLEDRGRGERYMEMVSRMVALAEDDISVTAKIDLVSGAMNTRAIYAAHTQVVDGMVEQIYSDHAADDRVFRLYVQWLLIKKDMHRALEMLKERISDELQEEDRYSYLMAIVEMEQRLQRPDSLLHYLGRVVALRPEDISLRLIYARTMIVEGRYEESLEELTRAKRYVKEDSLRSVLWSAEGDFRNHIAESRVNDDSSQGAKVSKGAKGVSKGERRLIYAAYERALRYAPENVSVLNNYAYILAINEPQSKRSLERALRMAQRVMELEPNNATHIDTHGWVLYLLGSYEQARDELRRALAFDKESNYEIALHYAEVLAVLEDGAMAEFYYKRAVEWGATEQEVLQSRERVAQGGDI